MAELSPAAQAVMDAFTNAACGETYQLRLGIAATLRAAALYSYCPVDRRILATIADELENNG
jgi:hypothetical protein